MIRFDGLDAIRTPFGSSRCDPIFGAQEILHPQLSPTSPVSLLREGGKHCGQRSHVSFWMPLVPRRVWQAYAWARPICMALSACRMQPSVRNAPPMARPTACFHNGITAKTSAAGIGVCNGDWPLWTDLRSTEGLPGSRHQQLLSPNPTARSSHGGDAGSLTAAGMRKELCSASLARQWSSARRQNAPRRSRQTASVPREESPRSVRKSRVRSAGVSSAARIFRR